MGRVNSCNNELVELCCNIMLSQFEWAIKPQIRILSTNYEEQKYRTISKHFPSNDSDVVLGGIIIT